MIEEKDIPHYRADREMLDMYKEMKRIGLHRFREIFGQEILDQLKGLIEDERRLIPIRNKIMLQGKLKCDFPMCEKCVHWDGANRDSKPCPYDDLEKNISFEKNELSQNPYPVEVCEKFIWKKDS